MARRMWALVALLVLVFIVDSCGGGGGGSTTTTPVIDDESPATLTNFVDSLDAYPIAGRTSFLRLELTSTSRKPGEAFGAKVFCKPKGKAEIEITTVTVDSDVRKPLVKIDASLGGRPLAKAGYSSYAYVTPDDAVAGDKILVSAEADARDMAMFLAEVNGWPVQGEPSIIVARNDNGDDVEVMGWIVAGLGIVGALLCPTEYGEVAVVGGEVVPPPTVTLAISGPAKARARDEVTVNVSSNCPEGWEASWAGGSKSGNGNGSFTIVMPNHDLTITVSDRCGNTKYHTVQSVNPPVNKPPVAILTVNPKSGDAPLTVHADGSGSYDPGGGTIVKYEWFFYGGGGHADVGGITMEHVYAMPGEYSVWLRVTDNDGATAMSATGVTVIVNAPPSDDYDGAVVSITPQGALLNATAGDEQQYVARIYASDGVSELPIPSGATIVWSSTASGAINANTGYFYSVLAGVGSFRVSATITWTNHQLTGDTPVIVN